MKNLAGQIMLRHSFYCLTMLCCLPTASSTAQAQVFAPDIILQIERESGEAKRVRLEYIKQEQERIRQQEQQYQQELTTLRATLPDQPRPPAMTVAARAQRATLEQNFGNWMALNDPKLRAGVTRGQIFNTMIRMLGPIASIRKARATDDSEGAFPSLSKGEHLTAADVRHLQVRSTATSGPRATERLNQAPLVFEWPYLLLNEWKRDCDAADKLRDEYVVHLMRAMKVRDGAHVRSHKDLDQCLELLEAKLLREKNDVMADPAMAADKRREAWEELTAAQEFVKRARASARRYKLAPTDLRDREFAGGSVEAFLDYCYSEGLEIAPALPEDEQVYFETFRKIQAYARDVMIIENRKEDLQLRIVDLEVTDRALLWEGANDDLDNTAPGQIIVAP